jgi:hypothetical protein
MISFLFYGAAPCRSHVERTEKNWVLSQFREIAQLLRNLFAGKTEPPVGATGVFDDRRKSLQFFQPVRHVLDIPGPAWLWCGLSAFLPAL